MTKSFLENLKDRISLIIRIIFNLCLIFVPKLIRHTDKSATQSTTERHCEQITENENPQQYEIFKDITTESEGETQKETMIEEECFEVNQCETKIYFKTTLKNENVENMEKDLKSPMKSLLSRKFRQLSKTSIDEVYDVLISPVANNDELHVYGELVACKMRPYSPQTKNIVQHHINSILFNADMGMYEPQSSNFSTYSSQTNSASVSYSFLHGSQGSHIPHAKSSNASEENSQQPDYIMTPNCAENFNYFY